MSLQNLKLLLLGILIGVLLLTGTIAFFSLRRMLQEVQLKYTNQGLLVQFDK